MKQLPKSKADIPSNEFMHPSYMDLLILTTVIWQTSYSEKATEHISELCQVLV